MPRAEQLAPAAQLQVFLGDPEPVLRLAHQGKAPLAGFGQFLAAQQHAAALFRSAPHPAAQLVQLGETEPFGLFDHHQCGRGDIDPDFDYRGRDQQPRIARSKTLHSGVLDLRAQLAVDHDDSISEPLLERCVARLGGGDVGEVGHAIDLAHHRADPIGLLTAGEMPFHPGDHFLHARLRNHQRLDRLPSGRELVEAAHVHFAILRQRQRARDRGRGHREGVRCAPALARQRQPLGDAEAVLLVDHHKAEVAVVHAVLKDRVGAHQQLDRAIEQPHQDRFALASLGAARQQRDLHPRRTEHLAQRLEMLAGEDFGGGQQRGLLARLDRDQHRIQRHHGLARTDIALQQAQHRCLLRHVARDLGDGALLRAGEAEGQLQLRAQGAVAHQRLPAPLAPVGLHQQQRKAVRQQFVIGQPVARLGLGAFVGELQRLAP